MDNLDKKLEEFNERIPALQAKARAEADPPEKNPVVQLPLWPEPVRAVPNGILRSALFGAVAKGQRRYMDGEQVPALEGIDIRYTGQRLDQGDLDVWESVLHVTRLQNMGEQCRFTAYSLLKLMGKTDSGANRENLHKRLIRLKANAVEIHQGRYSYAGSLIDDVYRDKHTHEYVLTLNAKLRPLFAADQFTQLQWAVRQDLHGQQIAQWLHGFYASHAAPFPVKVETLLKLCGSAATDPHSSKQKLRKALDAVLEASAAHSEGFSYEIKGDLVHVEKRASLSQRRHLAKKAKAKAKSRGG
jgi:hypothetical protein